jgi:hypothetical protein
VLSQVLSWPILLADEFLALIVSHLFVAGSAVARSFPETDSNYHDLPEDVFIMELKALNGTPPEVFGKPGLDEDLIRVRLCARIFAIAGDVSLTPQIGPYYPLITSPYYGPIGGLEC